MNQNKKNPIWWIPTVYFAMGIPFIVLSQVSVLIFKDLGVSTEEITFWTSWLILPWSLKWLISPVMETFGTKKKYIVATEFISAIMFGCIIFALPLPNFFTITLALMSVMALSGSMHDIAGDGVYMDELDTETQSRYSGWQGAFYNMAKVLANGGLVFLAGWLVKKGGFSQIQAWQSILFIFAAVMLAVALYHVKFLPQGKIRENDMTMHEKFVELGLIFVDFFKKPYIWLYLVFVFLYRFAEGLAVKVVPIFLKDTVAVGGIGMDNEQYGLVYGTFGAVAFIAGSILAGYYISHFGLKKVIFSLVCIFNIPFAIYFIFAVYQPHEMWQIALGIVFEYFTYGFGFVGIILFMMQQIAPGKYQMAHYAIANSIVNFGVMFPGMISGYLSTAPNQIKILNTLGLGSYTDALSPYLGYQLFFAFVIIMTLPSILLCKFVPFTHKDKSEEA